METYIDTIKKELRVYGLEITKDNLCKVHKGSSAFTITIPKTISLLHTYIKKNTKLFNDLWEELSNLILGSSCTNFIKDTKLINLFINSVKELYSFAQILCINTKKAHGKLGKVGIFLGLSNLLNSDINQINKEMIDIVPEYKIAIDWVFRKNCQLSYIVNLLKALIKDCENGKVKTARGISGPWANLDLPMKERAFEWADIDDEVRGREQDKQKQFRYRKGLEEYNNDGRVGEGHYWREIRNEPFSWYDRATESPYPSRSLLSK